MHRALTLSLFALLGFAVGARSAAPKPYNPKANAGAQLHHALAEARANHEPVLVFFGANWCEDCRSLAHALKSGRNARLMDRHFNIVKVDVGNFNRNLDIDKRYGDPIHMGIPAAVILSPKGKLLYATRAGELANARQMSDRGVYDFFRQRLASLHDHATR